ncbi:MAG: hypothetical protein ACI36V_07810 [Coriobacteriales bacterium]
MKTFSKLSSAGQQLIDLAIRARVNEQVARENRMYALAKEHQGEEHGLLTAAALVENITFSEAYAVFS